MEGGAVIEGWPEVGNVASDWRVPSDGGGGGMQGNGGLLLHGHLSSLGKH